MGKSKFTYDIWGDAVNLAARLESASEPRRTNVSTAVIAQASAYFTFTPRGRVEVKNKDPLDMYFLERIRPEFSADALGEAPNEALLRQRKQLSEATMGMNADGPTA